jgi:hypothetical protein
MIWPVKMLILQAIKNLPRKKGRVFLEFPAAGYKTAVYIIPFYKKERNCLQNRQTRQLKNDSNRVKAMLLLLYAKKPLIYLIAFSQEFYLPAGGIYLKNQ